MIERIISDGMTFALPLFVMAIGGIYSERSGITNLALEGLQGVGAFVGALVAVLLTRSMGDESWVPYYLSLLFAMLGGMLYSMVHALLCVKFQANQVISGVVVNILAVALTTVLTKQMNRWIFGSPSDKLILRVSEKWTIWGRSIYPFELIIIVVAVITWYVLYKTRYGLHLRACGDNPHAVDAAGIHVARIRFRAVLVSGALCGLAGISFAYSISASFSPGIYVGYGYLSIAALIFGNWKIVPTLAACLFFGIAKAAGYQLVQAAGLPGSYADLIMILPYVLTLLLLVFFSKHNHAPRALGEVYDKGKR